MVNQSNHLDVTTSALHVYELAEDVILRGFAVCNMPKGTFMILYLQVVYVTTKHQRHSANDNVGHEYIC